MPQRKSTLVYSFAWYFMQTNDAAKFVWYQFKLCQLKITKILTPNWGENHKIMFSNGS
jgi:hypothetical protein